MLQLTFLVLGATQYTLLHSSLVMMNVSAYMTPAAIVASLVIKRTLRFKYMIVTGWVLLAVGMGVNVRHLIFSLHCMY